VRRHRDPGDVLEGQQEHQVQGSLSVAALLCRDRF